MLLFMLRGYDVVIGVIFEKRKMSVSGYCRDTKACALLTAVYVQGNGQADLSI